MEELHIVLNKQQGYKIQSNHSSKGCYTVTPCGRMRLERPGPCLRLALISF